MSLDDVHAALDADAFELWFQPIVCLRTLEVRSFEGLARCRTDTGDVVMPAAFIDVIENDETTYQRFTNRMIELAVDFAQRCTRIGTSPLVTVNLAEASLRDGTMVDRLEALLRHTRIPPRQLVFEITEREFINPESAHSGVLERLSALGVGLAIDDFGTGWSSLETLRWLPLSQIKIDRSFLDRLADNTADRIIVDKVIELAHSLHLLVIAEGIERVDQLQALRTAGCNRGQGFLFSPAVDPDTALGLAATGVARPSLPAVQELASEQPAPPAAFEPGSGLVVEADATCIGEVIDDPSTLGSLALQALELLPMAVFIKSTDGRIVWSNESHWRRLGASSQADILDHRDLELHRVDDALRYRVDDLSVLTSGTPVVDRREAQTRPDGSRVLLRTSKFPVHNRHGDVIGLVGFYTEFDEGDVGIDRDLARLSGIGMHGPAGDRTAALS